MIQEAVHNYYDILGVERSASAEDITLAYRQLLSETNTFDSDSEREEEAIALIKTVTLAYRTLVDEQKRREYDALLYGQHRGQVGDTAVYDVAEVSLAESPSLTSTELAALKDEESAINPLQASRVVYEVGQALSPQSEDEIPESWRREREFFEEHFEEILKPAPKVDLVGLKKPSADSKEGPPAVTEWDDSPPATQATSRFGTILDPRELTQLQTIPTPRRAIVRSLVADPFDLMVYIGLPVMGVIIAIEFLVYMR
jgi:curved DNA-binding protein CbpA